MIYTRNNDIVTYSVANSNTWFFPTDVSSLTIFAHYDDQWNSKNEDIDFKMVGLLVPIDCNLVSLKHLVANTLQTMKPPSDITL